MGIPLFVSRVATCPACQQRGVIQTPNPALYHAVKREADLHVLEYRWSIPAGERLMPHHFDVWQCPECLYADLVSNVEKAERSLKDYHARIAWQKATEEQVESIRALRAVVSGQEVDLDGAMAIHLAALFIGSLPAQEFIDHDRVGRIALRLAWLFRERRDAFEERVIVRCEQDELSECIERLESQLLATSATLDETVAALRARDERAGLSPDEADAGSSMAIAASLMDKLTEMQTLLTMLHGVEDFAEASSGSAGPGDDPVLGPLGEALIRLRSVWSKVPLSEMDCLRTSVSCLDYAFRHEFDHVSIEHTLTTLTLVLGMKLRLGEQVSALETISEIYNSGMEHRRALSRRLEEGKRSRRVSAHDERMLTRKINIVHSAIQQAGETRIKIFEDLFEDHRRIIEETLSRTTGLEPSQETEKLVAAGVPEELVTFLRARGQLVHPS